MLVIYFVLTLVIYPVVVEESEKPQVVMDGNMQMKFLNLANSVALCSDYRVKMGAVIVSHGRPISIGYNQETTHPKLIFDRCATVHAEVNALFHARKNELSGATAYVYRNKNGNPSLARPCNNCYKKLKEYGIKKIIYSTEEYPYFLIERI